MVENLSETGIALAGARERLLARIPADERRMKLAGIPTAVLERGKGEPIVLLHGPGEHAAKWLRVFPELTKTFRVVAPDLPGHGASETEGPLEAGQVLDWLGELIEATCPTPPAVVGQIVGGAIAARFAALRGERISRLVLVDTLGLAPFEPAPDFGAALMGFLSQPTSETHDGLWERCAFDFDGLRAEMGDDWRRLKAYNLDRAVDPKAGAALHRLMEQFGLPAIDPGELARIVVPTALIWGRHDLATPLAVAQAASARYGWPLRVIENAGDDPAMEQPAAFVRALRLALDG